MRKLLTILFLVGFSNLYSQSLIQTYVDRCTGAVNVFTVPMNGQTTVVFYNKSRTFTSQQFQNGELQSWLEETYFWWASLNPCSTATTTVVTTQAQTQQTTQQATEAAAAATAAASAATPPPVPDSPPPVAPPPAQTATTGTTDTTATTGTTNTSTNDTSTQNTTGNTSSSGSTDSGGSTSNTDTGSSGSGEGTTSNDSSGTTEGGSSDGGSTETETKTEETKTEETKTEETKSTEETSEVEETSTEESSTEESTEESSSEESKEESKEETKEEEKKEETKEEESKEEEKKEEEKSEEKEEEKKEEEKSDEEKEKEKEEEDKKKKEEEKKKKKEARQLSPPIITANVAMMQGPDGSYSYASTFGVSRSSLMGDKTYGLNTMVWSNLQQFMVNANFTKIHINKEGRPSRVYSASLGGAKMFTTVMGNMNHSVVFLGKKGSAAGFALGTSITAIDLNIVNGLVYYDETILSQSITGFYTKPIPLGRVSVSPMVAVSSPFVSLETFSRRTTWSTDVMFIGGLSGTFNITKRFGANLGVNAVTSTIPGFPVLINYTIGSRFSF